MSQLLVPGVAIIVSGDLRKGPSASAGRAAGCGSHIMSAGPLLSLEAVSSHSASFHPQKPQSPHLSSRHTCGSTSWAAKGFSQPFLPGAHPGACVLSHCSQVQLFCDSMDCSLPGPSVHGISQVRILEWVAISFARGSCSPRDRTCIRCTGRRILDR